MDFGFKISPSSTIDLASADLSLLKKIEAIEPDIKSCMACGSCSATCPAAPYSGMSMRKLILYLQRGRDKDAAQLLSACMLCGKCTMVCPRGINTRHIILSVCRCYEEKEGKR